MAFTTMRRKIKYLESRARLKGEGPPNVTLELLAIV
jgi:hypothetical protein